MQSGPQKFKNKGGKSEMFDYGQANNSHCRNEKKSFCNYTPV